MQPAISNDPDWIREAVLAYFFPERGSIFAARAEAGRSRLLAGWSFESFVADEVEPDGQIGLTSSIRHIEPPGKNGDSDFTNAGASPPRIQMCESGGVLPNSEAIAPVTPGTSTFTT